MCESISGGAVGKCLCGVPICESISDAPSRCVCAVAWSTRNTRPGGAPTTAGTAVYPAYRENPASCKLPLVFESTARWLLLVILKSTGSMIGRMCGRTQARTCTYEEHPMSESISDDAVEMHVCSHLEYPEHPAGGAPITAGTALCSAYTKNPAASLLLLVFERAASSLLPVVLKSSGSMISRMCRRAQVRTCK